MSRHLYPSVRRTIHPTSQSWATHVCHVGRDGRVRRSGTVADVQAGSPEAPGAPGALFRAVERWLGDESRELGTAPEQDAGPARAPLGMGSRQLAYYR